MRRALIIHKIRALLASGLAFTVPEIAQRVSCHRTAAYNCLAVMQRHGEVRRQRQEKFYVYRRAA
ncbi:helix-turn-helix domain-containing protein [Deinococcus hopiensis]|uniref:Uncharacterized protein n=1 Tax=Deinococcus hopiensis KR-140 TaxID=695939 RepID=A0A1W1V817_9DEIO|nr:helix-turn-helix domain-containing protein [Deinococcus hopiensis]SMB89134.1 hypothetical protein SAMN00790413_00282 [Deinococcus hopiensis KR-140]